MLDHSAASVPRLRLTQIQPSRIKQRTVLDMQRQFEKRPRIERSKNLTGPVPITHGLVVPPGRVVLVSRFIQQARTLGALQEPVRPNARCGRRGAPDASEFLVPLSGTVP